MTGTAHDWHQALDEYERVLDRCRTDFARVGAGEAIVVAPHRFPPPAGPMPAECVSRARALAARTDALIHLVGAAVEKTAPPRPVTFRPPNQSSRRPTEFDVRA